MKLIPCPRRTLCTHPVLVIFKSNTTGRRQVKFHHQRAPFLEASRGARCSRQAERVACYGNESGHRPILHAGQSCLLTACARPSRLHQQYHAPRAPSENDGSARAIRRQRQRPSRCGCARGARIRSRQSHASSWSRRQTDSRFIILFRLISEQYPPSGESISSGCTHAPDTSMFAKDCPQARTVLAVLVPAYLPFGAQK